MRVIMMFGCLASAACSGAGSHPPHTGGGGGARSGGAPGSGGLSHSGGGPGSGGAGAGGAGTGGLETGGSGAATGGQLGTGGAGGNLASGGVGGGAGLGGAAGAGDGQAGRGGSAGAPRGGASGAGGGGGTGVPCGAPTSTCTCVGFDPPADHPLATDYDLATPDVVIDKVSGLTWERNAVADGGRMPCPEVLAGCSSSSDRADVHCIASRTGGFSDWRVPTVLQLTSITDFAAANPAVNATVFPNTPADYFWTSTPVFSGPPTGSAIGFWTVNTRDGSNTNGNPNLTSPVRCVRATATSCFPKAERFLPSPISSVPSTIDRTTWLTWQKGHSPQPLSWAAAKDYCTGQGSRLPTVKELVSLVDFDKRVPPAIDTVAFPNTPSEDFWTVTPAAGAEGRAMKVSFTYGGVYGAVTSVANYVRCVR